MSIKKLRWVSLSANSCQRFLVSVINTTQVEKIRFGDITSVRDFLDVFSEKLPRVTTKLSNILWHQAITQGRPSTQALY